MEKFKIENANAAETIFFQKFIFYLLSSLSGNNFDNKSLFEITGRG